MKGKMGNMLYIYTKYTYKLYRFEHKKMLNITQNLLLKKLSNLAL